MHGDQTVQLTVFLVVFGAVTIIGFAAARWRRPESIHTLEEWGLGGRAFGNWVTHGHHPSRLAGPVRRR